MFKNIVLVACLAVVVSARIIEPYQGVLHNKYYNSYPKIEYQPVNYHYSYPKYVYSYGVKDWHTHDHKYAWEHRDGDVVRGQYSVDDPDGTHRVVDYRSDHKSGFRARVQRIGYARHPHGTSYVKIDQHF